MLYHEAEVYVSPRVQEVVAMLDSLQDTTHHLDRVQAHLSTRNLSDPTESTRDLMRQRDELQNTRQRIINYSRFAISELSKANFEILLGMREEIVRYLAPRR